VLILENTSRNVNAVRELRCVVKCNSQLDLRKGSCTILLYLFNLPGSLGVMINTTYSEARQNLATLLKQVSNDREIAIIKRRGHEDVALVSADELSGLLETAHLLRSPANAKRLLAALGRAQTKKLAPTALDTLRTELGLDGEG
jgi:antitoxin YefM